MIFIFKYIYNALGIKIRKTVTQGDTQATTHYLGSFQYNNNTLQYIHTSEGYVRHTPPTSGTNYGAFDYVYNYTVHLGNIRVSYTVDPSDQVLKILEKNHYYPFGMKHSYNGFKKDIRPTEEYLNPQNVTLDPTNDPRRVRMVSNNGYQYKYNGKEYPAPRSLLSKICTERCDSKQQSRPTLQKQYTSSFILCKS